MPLGDQGGYEMEKRYRDYQPDQLLLMPPSLREWLGEDHLAYFVSDVVDQLDLGAITMVYERESRGQPPYHPVMMTKLLLYGYCVGRPSSRRIERKTHEDVGFRFLAAGQHPDHATISEFRKRHLKALGRLFVQVLLLCEKAGLVKLGHVALDGTKVKANASRHKAMSYGRMGERERELQCQVDELLREAGAIDEEEDRRYGKNRRGDELPEELRFREGRLEKIREAKAALEREAREKALAKGQIDEEGRPKPRCGPKPKAPLGKPKKNDQRNFTDPESRIMKDSATKSFMQSYNAQAAVDAKAQIIVAADVTAQANDKGQIRPMVNQIEFNLGKRPRELSADSDYFSEADMRFLEERGIESFVTPDKQKHTRNAVLAPKGRIPKRLLVADRMRRKLQTKRGRARYGLRKETVEPVFGQIKHVRGLRSFLLRGLQKAKGEWQLICLGHNLLKLFRSSQMVAAA